MAILNPIESHSIPLNPINLAINQLSYLQFMAIGSNRLFQRYFNRIIHKP